MTSAPEQLADRYTLLDRIAAGGMGEVWRARDEVLGRDVAVKLLKDGYVGDPAFRTRFRNEARHAAALSHPGIATVYDYGEAGDVAYLVMELVHGEPLSSVIARRAPLPPAETLDILGQVALALQAAHDVGVVHRDVKPGNLLLRPDGVVKVTDFGIARATGAAPVTQTGTIIGTAAYLSPEQASGHPATPASDLYALSVVGYECLTGARPFSADSAVGLAMAHASAAPAPLPDSVPAPVSDFVLRGLAKDPAARARSAGDYGRTALALAADLRHPTAVLTDPAPRPAATDRTARLEPAGAPAGAPAAADEAERRRVRNVFLAVGAAVVLLGFVVLHSCAAGGTYATVPRLTGQRYSAAAATLTREHLHPARAGRHAAARPGTVLAQSDPPGARVPTGHTVTLTVSLGPATVTVRRSDYVGRPQADVVAALRAAHLDPVVDTVPGTAAPGTVTDVHPTGEVPRGATVTVTVAAALPPTGPPAAGGPRKHGHDEHHGPKSHDD